MYTSLTCTTSRLLLLLPLLLRLLLGLLLLLQGLALGQGGPGRGLPLEACGVAHVPGQSHRSIEIHRLHSPGGTGGAQRQQPVRPLDHHVLRLHPALHELLQVKKDPARHLGSRPLGE